MSELLKDGFILTPTRRAWLETVETAPIREAEDQTKPKKVKRSAKRARFYRSPEWREAREKCFAEKGRACVECGCPEQINVDHIKPRSKFPELALVQSNLRPLCWPCNKRKGTK